VKKIYVGNFSFHMTESELRALFEPFGAIESVSLATDRDTGRSRGFGFVSMTNDQEAEKAMAALNGKESDGRALTVNEARPQGAALVKSGGVARRLRGASGSSSDITSMGTVVCAKCGQRFAIGCEPLPNAELTERRAAWVADQLVWDRIQERKHHGTIELPNLSESTAIR